MNLTKRDLILGNQCRKAAWLRVHKPELAADPEAGAQLRYEQGNLVDQVARQVYEGGEFIAGLDWEPALHQTQALIEAGVRRLYQPAFSAMGLHIRADILDILPGRMAILREVKMSSRLKDEHLLDVATQVCVLQESGYTIKEACLVLINSEHTPENGISLFHEIEVTEDALALAGQLGSEVAGLSEAVVAESEPDVRIGKHCTKPWPCPFLDYCWENVPKDSVLSIPRLTAKKLAALQDRDILHLNDVPADFALTEKQWEYVHFQTSGSRIVDVHAINAALNAFTYPLYFLDFETHSSPIPPYPYTRPYQQVPFQFSIHVLQEDRSVSHHDYLHTTDSDPRNDLTEHLLRYIGETGTILTYNAQFEIKVLTELAAALPPYADALQQVIARIHDQLPLIRKNVQDPMLYRSYSLKTVTRVLVGDDTYSTLHIANGESAHAAWVRMHEETDSDHRQSIIDNLKAYCYQDTLAQVNLHYWCEELVKYG